ncbi:MAG: tetratricopeptide repeat protein [Candidatus Sulfotelmatobacter sp.]
MVVSVAAQTGLTSSTETSPPTARELQLHACLEQATQAMHQGDNAAAAEAFRRALEIDPHSLVALNDLGIVVTRQGRPGEALRFYEQALEFRPDDPSTRRNLAIESIITLRAPHSIHTALPLVIYELQTETGLFPLDGGRFSSYWCAVVFSHGMNFWFS